MRDRGRQRVRVFADLLVKAPRLLLQCFSRKTAHPGMFNTVASDEIMLGAIYPAQGDPMYDEVKSFFTSSPSAKIEFATVNPAAAEMFVPGKRYRVTIEEVVS